MKSDYEEHKRERLERLEELAAKKKQESEDLWEKGHDMASAIPFGQPILVGHHSEKRDRNYRNRIDGTFRKANATGKKADYYEQRAAAANNNTAISSDDPEAILKLKEKIANAMKSQEIMKAANKIIKSKKTDEAQRCALLAELGLNEQTIKDIIHPPYYRGIGFPGYKLTNNNANIRRMKQRLATLAKAATEVTTECEINGVTICDNVEENRLQMFFPDKPSEEVRALLKSRGFKWARSVGAWMRYRSNSAMYEAKHIAETLQQ